MNDQKICDVAIVGGGLAGLAAAILCARNGLQVVVLEKEFYPYHKVCGEYISNESRNFLTELGVPVDALSLPEINRLIVTSPSGNKLSTHLSMGGFGISRYMLDHLLVETARGSGVEVKEGSKVTAINFNETFSITSTGGNGNEILKAKFCMAAYGKRSNLDVKWDRSFLKKQDKRLDNYVAVKYHAVLEWPSDTIALHNFKNGYCGVSRVEQNKSCICYLVKATELQTAGNSIDQLEKNCLSENPELSKLLKARKILEGFPVTISQINFHERTKVEDHVLMIGDTAGMITPLCGNGMSIALHTGKIAAELCMHFLQGNMSREKVEKTYAKAWEDHFGKRFRMGRMLQRFFGSKRLSNVFIGMIKTFPFLAKPLVKSTHGKAF